MKIIRLTLLAWLSAIAPLYVAAQDVPSGFHFVWSDEFNGNALDEKTWNVEVSGSGGGNQELEYYRRENVAVADGNLVLTAKKENYEGKSFTSGRINTSLKTAFKHGIMQARVKMPKTANGLWPAYWMMGNDMNKYGWPRCGEMDIVEMGNTKGITNGTQTRYFAGSLHYGPNATNEGHQQKSMDFTAPEDNAVENDEYHTFTVYWDNDVLEMYYDLDLKDFDNFSKANAARYFNCNIPTSNNDYAAGKYFQKPFFFLFNLAVGGNYTNIYDPNGITALPNAGDEAKMYVDWVRVYQADDDTDAQYLYIDGEGNSKTNIPVEQEPDPQEDTKTELSSFATKALDADGATTFDFDDAKDVVLISTSAGVTDAFKGRDAIKANYNVDETKNFLYIWDNTYVVVPTTGQTNSFGWTEGYNKYTVASVGWSGLGFASSEGNGKDLSMIDDSYWLHFAMRATDTNLHTSHTVTVGDAKFIIGNTDGNNASLGDFKRDGEWYYFDIPVKALREFADPIFGTTASSYVKNAIAFLSGGTTDATLCFDNIFFYKSSSKTVPSFTDNSADLGKYGYKSLDNDGKPVFAFDNVKNVIPLVMSQDMWENLTAGGSYSESTISKDYDYSEQAGKNQFFIWSNTFNAKSVTGIANSFGNTPSGGFNSYASAIATWNGMGYASNIDGSTVAPKDLSMIDDTYYVHFSLRSDAAVGHVPVSIKFGSGDNDASLTFGKYSTKPLFADFNRNGEWYSFDIPVSVIKKYGTLFGLAGTDNNGTINAFKGYDFCINTMPTYYSGSYFSYDNVFFYQKKDSEIPEEDLGEYTKKSLDENNKSYFDFNANTNYIIIDAGAAERQAMTEDKIAADYSVDDINRHLYIWENTYTTGTKSGTTENSFGNIENWLDQIVSTTGWSGLGYTNTKGSDLSMLDDTYYLHFAMRGTDTASHRISIGNSKFTIGPSAFSSNAPIFGNYKRDGNWYSYDIPFSELTKLNSAIFGTSTNLFTGNVFAVESGGTTGTEVQIDNIFFYKSISSDINLIDNEKTKIGGTLGIFDITGRKVNATDKPGLYIIRTIDNVKKIIVK